MSPRRFIISAIAVGVAIPLLWLALYWGVLRGNPRLINNLMSAGRLDLALLAVWPSWILLVADPEERSVAIPAASIAVNGVLYGGLGWLVWFGLYRKPAAIAVAALAILVGWYFLFGWYTGVRWS
jgi:hypothetical protein